MTWSIFLLLLAGFYLVAAVPTGTQQKNTIVFGTRLEKRIRLGPADLLEHQLHGRPIIAVEENNDEEDDVSLEEPEREGKRYHGGERGTTEGYYRRRIIKRKKSSIQKRPVQATKFDATSVNRSNITEVIDNLSTTTTRRPRPTRRTRPTTVKVESTIADDDGSVEVVEFLADDDSYTSTPSTTTITTRRTRRTRRTRPTKPNDSEADNTVEIENVSFGDEQPQVDYQTTLSSSTSTTKRPRRTRRTRPTETTTPLTLTDQEKEEENRVEEDSPSSTTSTTKRPRRTRRTKPTEATSTTPLTTPQSINYEFDQNESNNNNNNNNNNDQLPIFILSLPTEKLVEVKIQKPVNEKPNEYVQDNVSPSVRQGAIANLQPSTSTTITNTAATATIAFVTTKELTTVDQPLISTSAAPVQDIPVKIIFETISKNVSEVTPELRIQNLDEITKHNTLEQSSSTTFGDTQTNDSKVVTVEPTADVVSTTSAGTSTTKTTTEAAV